MRLVLKKYGVAFPLLLVGVPLAYVFWSYGTFAHFDEWAGTRLYPALALAKGTDLYQLEGGPFVFTMYGPGGPLFYLPAALGAEPKQCFWIAYSLNLVTLLVCAWFFFAGNNWDAPSDREPRKRLPFLFLSMAWLLLLASEKTMSSLFTIHMDLPTVAYLSAGILLLRRYEQSRRTRDLWLGTVGLWLATWTKIVALPCLLLPLVVCARSGQKGKTIATNALPAIAVSGLALATLFSMLFGPGDLWFHLASNTNAFPWRECTALFGEEGEKLIGTSFTDRLEVLVRLSGLYMVGYWPFVVACGLIVLTQSKDKRDGTAFYLALAYFLLLPTSLSALAKFGGVENSLLFAHFAATLAIFRVTGNLLLSHTSPSLAVVLVTILALILSMTPIRIARGAIRKVDESPQQRAYEYLRQSKDSSIYFAWSPMPHLLATGDVFDSGETLLYSTMTSSKVLHFKPECNPASATKFIAVGPTGYSTTFFKKYYNLTETEPRKELPGWRLYHIER